jgi:hypothetical protein
MYVLSHQDYHHLCSLPWLLEEALERLKSMLLDVLVQLSMSFRRDSLQLKRHRDTLKQSNIIRISKEVLGSGHF